MEADLEEQMAGESLGDKVSSMDLSCVLMRVFRCRIDGTRNKGEMLDDRWESEKVHTGSGHCLG